PIVAPLGPAARSGTPEEAAAFGEVVQLAVPFGALAELGPRILPAIAGKVVLDAGNPFPHRDGVAAAEAIRDGRGSGRWTAKHLPGARLVKAFNTIFWQMLQTEAHRAGDRLGVPLASDDAGALEVAARLVRDAGFEPVVVGGLDRAKDFDPESPVWNRGMTARALRHHFGLPEAR
ncbi:MAG TPA: NADP oxidoreductase, partial [Anaeromyxobacteraceae bacterium]|nr:NADP oxidoreductase [Anaeromyxobacteraceae bacterium]